MRFGLLIGEVLLWLASLVGLACILLVVLAWRSTSASSCSAPAPWSPPSPAGLWRWSARSPPRAWKAVRSSPQDPGHSGRRHGPRAIEEEHPADLEAMTVFRPVHPGHETNWVGSFSSEEEERWLRVGARMPLTLPTRPRTPRAGCGSTSRGTGMRHPPSCRENLLPRTRPVRRRKQTRPTAPRVRAAPRRTRRNLLRRGPTLRRHTPRARTARTDRLLPARAGGSRSALCLGGASSSAQLAGGEGRCLSRTPDAVAAPGEQPLC